MGWKDAGTWAWRALRWIFKAAVFTAVLLGLLLLAAGVPEYVDMSRLSASGANAWLMALGLGAIAAILYYAFRGLVWAYSAPIWGVFGENRVARLVALGAVAYFLPRAVFALITAPVTVAVQLVRDLPPIVRRLAEHEITGTVALDLTLARAAWTVETLGYELSRALGRLIDQVPVAESILALALWAILGQLLSGTVGAAQGQSTVRALALLRALSQPQKRIASLVVVFLAGIYLSTAAIVAIPWLEEDGGQQTFTRERLEKALEPLVPKGGEERGLVSASDPAEHFKSIEQMLSEAQARAAQERGGKPLGLSAPADSMADLRRVAFEAKRARDRAAELRGQMLEDFLLRRGQVAGEALAAFDALTVVPMNSQERAFYYHGVQRSARQHIDDLQRGLRACDRSVAELDRQAQLAATELAAFFKRADPGGPTAYGEMYGRLANAPAALRTCETREVRSLYVDPLEPGEGWGPFALVSQWLLRTRSQELALITGMFGFGLLGSAVVTFVRPRRATRSGEDSVAIEVAGIVARGLSAAIVVFLAVKGGLAVFSSSAANPNAYVVFFTCLLGAVFSEHVWAWAKKKLADLLVRQEQAAEKAEKRATKA